LDASLPLSVSVGNSAEMLATKEQSYNIEYNRKRKKSQKPVKKTLKNQYMDSHLMTICKCGLSKINVGRRENINKNDYPCRVSQIS
jgi:ribosomal protein S20